MGTKSAKEGRTILGVEIKTETPEIENIRQDPTVVKLLLCYMIFPVQDKSSSAPFSYQFIATMTRGLPVSYAEWCLWDFTPYGSCENRRFGGT
jgi:hypothetical protein